MSHNFRTTEAHQINIFRIIILARPSQATSNAAVFFFCLSHNNFSPTQASDSQAAAKLFGFAYYEYISLVHGPLQMTVFRIIFFSCCCLVRKNKTLCAHCSTVLPKYFSLDVCVCALWIRQPNEEKLKRQTWLERRRGKPAQHREGAKSDYEENARSVAQLRSTCTTGTTCAETTPIAIHVRSVSDVEVRTLEMVRTHIQRPPTRQIVCAGPQDPDYHFVFMQIDKITSTRCAVVESNRTGWII